MSQVQRTNVVNVAAFALIPSLDEDSLSIVGVCDLHPLVAVTSTTVNIVGDGNDVIAVYVFEPASAETDVKPGGLS